MVEDILPPAGALVAVDLGWVRCGLVSCELLLRDLVLPAVEAVLEAAGRTGARPGEVSREASGEDFDVEVCVAGWDGWLLVSAFIVEALEDSRVNRAGTWALAAVGSAALLGVVSILTTVLVDGCEMASEGAPGNWLGAGRGKECGLV